MSIDNVSTYNKMLIHIELLERELMFYKTNIL